MYAKTMTFHVVRINESKSSRTISEYRQSCSFASPDTRTTSALHRYWSIDLSEAFLGLATYHGTVVQARERERVPSNEPVQDTLLLRDLKHILRRE